MSTLLPGDLSFPQPMPDAQWTASLEDMAPGVTRLIAENGNTGEDWASTLARLLPVIASTYQQKQLLDVQVQRAQQGLPPLDAGQYAPGVKVGLDAQTQQMLLWGGVGVLALLAFMAIRK
jgi:hypothetical protein